MKTKQRKNFWLLSAYMRKIKNSKTIHPQECPFERMLLGVKVLEVESLSGGSLFQEVPPLKVFALSEH